jgi:5-formyltetrahydrofolate cyclo-ligase
MMQSGTSPDLSLSAQKAQFRQVLLARRRAVEPAQAAEWSGRICEHLQRLIAPAAGKAVAVYAASNAEVVVNQWIDYAFQQKILVLLPVVTKPEKTLKFLEYAPGMTLIEGEYGIARPPLGAREATPQVVVVPLVGFDLQGRRLGYGGGYYDTTLAALRSANNQVQTIGVAYSVQRVEHIPTQAHDVLLDVVVTEQGMHDCTQGTDRK